MTESKSHRHLVNCIVEFIHQNYTEGILFVDDGVSTSPEQNYFGFRPDVTFISEEILVIGEAKTGSDLETKHSRKQIQSYFETTIENDARVVIVIAVPWSYKASATNMLINYRNKYNKRVEIKIITDADFR